MGDNVVFYHVSNFIYIQLMISILGEQTLDAKKFYERRTASYGVKFKICHSYNGRYAEKIFWTQFKIPIRRLPCVQLAHITRMVSLSLILKF